MSDQSCCVPRGLCENVECTVEETSSGLSLHMRGKTPEQTEALKTFYSSWKILRGEKQGDNCCCG